MTRPYGILCRFIGPTVGAKRGWRPWSWFDDYRKRNKALDKARRKWGEFYVFKKTKRKIAPESTQ